MATNLELCIQFQNEVEKGISKMYEDWKGGIRQGRNFIIIYTLIFVIAMILSAFSIARQTSFVAIFKNFNIDILVGTFFFVSIGIAFFKVFKPIHYRDHIFSFIKRSLAIKSFLLIELYLFYIMSISFSLINIQNMNPIIFSLIFIEISSFIVSLLISICIYFITSMDFIFVTIAEMNSNKNNYSVEKIYTFLQDELNEILNPIETIQLEQTLDLLIQRRETRMHSVSIISLIMTVAALVGILVSMGAGVLAAGDKIFSFFSIVEQSPVGVTSVLTISIIAFLFGSGIMFGVSVYYRAFVASSTQNAIRVHLQQRQLEIIEKKKLLEKLVLS
ncbi:hypothetical protein [Herpetosiphon geysericola]|uniref:Uncharacterized protein n=1 Tax=Herpetosiphon geysericola TaxID=70996 RepID=A0A0P6XBX6_9CHLR|nr:hypothetical protein [Herpetosiphon geysericola]KPL80283.1 hypothetical protein SE18_24860 [Herpetosiphon geysericola]